MAETKTGYRATAKWLMASPSKVRPVADLVRKQALCRGRSRYSTTCPTRAPSLIKKVVVSAAANALNQNRKLDEDMLYVREIRIDEGPRMRRVWFRARGRADMLLKRMCHISCVIDEIGKKTEA